jgi:hypothetical protein
MRSSTGAEHTPGAGAVRSRVPKGRADRRRSARWLYRSQGRGRTRAGNRGSLDPGAARKPAPLMLQNGRSS